MRLLNFINWLFAKKKPATYIKHEIPNSEFHRALQQAANRAVKEYWRKRYGRINH